jgi:hypothetical protein
MTLETQLRETLRAKADRLPDPDVLDLQLRQPNERRHLPSPLIAVSSFAVVIVLVGAIAFLVSGGRAPVGGSIPATPNGPTRPTTNTTAAVEVIPPGGAVGDGSTGTTIAFENGVAGFETGVTQNALGDAVQLGLPELTADGWSLDLTTPTGERLKVTLAEELGPFESVQYAPILHITTPSGEGLPMVLARSMAAQDVAQAFTSAPIDEASDSVTEEADVRNWTAPGTDVTTITWHEWVLGIWDTPDSTITAGEIAAALEFDETPDGFLLVTSGDPNILVRAQSAASIRYGQPGDTGFNLQIAPTCDVYHSGEAPFTQELVQSGSRAMWCQAGHYQIAVSVDGSSVDMTLGTVHDSLDIQPG